MADPGADATALAARLEGVFRAIAAERMHDVPILNPALEVEAVGMRPWRGHWLCALVTPWFISLVLLRGDGAWRSVPGRDSVWHDFPSGHFEFLGASEPGLGEFHACSLFSPVQEFADHATARETARIALESLFDPALLGEGPRNARTGGPGLSRRDFLRGTPQARS